MLTRFVRRVRRPIGVSAVALLLAGGAVALTAAPASAFTDPPVLTVTGNPAYEDYNGVYFGGECPVGSNNAVVSWPASGGSTQTIEEQALDGNGAFSGAGSYYPVFPFVPGTTIAFTLTCRTGTTVAATSTTNFTFPDLGATVTLPTTATVSTPISLPYDCGTAIGGSTLSSADITIYNAADALVATIPVPALPSGTAVLGTPASYGFAVGDTFRAYLDCNATTGGPEFRSGYRGGAVTTVVAAAPVTPVTPAVPAAGGQAALADTGVDTAVGTLVAALLLTMGGFLVLRARRGPKITS